MSKEDTSNIFFDSQDTQYNEFKTEKELKASKVPRSLKTNNQHEVNSESETPKDKLMKITRGKSLQLVIDGYFIPSWNERGGRNKKLIDEISKPRENLTKYARFRIDQMNFNEITPHIANTLKYPLYVIVDQLDEFLLNRQSQTTGFDKKDMPSKKYIKEYLLHVDPSDVLNCWTSFNSYRGQTKAGKSR